MKRLFFLPSFNDEEKQRTGQYLNIIVLSAFVLLSVLLVIRFFQDFIVFSPTNILLFVLVVILVGLRVMVQYGYIRATSIILITLTWLAMTYQAYDNSGILDVSVTAYIVVMLMASLLLGWRYSLSFFGLSIAAMIVFAILESTGSKAFNSDTPVNIAIDLTIIFSLILVLTYLLVSSLQQSIKNARASAQELMAKNTELLALQVNIEQRVSSRTKALATSAEVSRRLSTILDQRQLVRAVVEQVQSAFGYYHAHIYLVDETNGDLVMAGGTGKAGETMLALGHKVLKGRGLVGLAAENAEPVLVSDTSQNPNWLPNSLLPETKSEIAIPIQIGTKVLGVLDVQHNLAGGLKNEDVDALQAIANQVAVALQNIQQYEKTRKIANDMGVVANVSLTTSTITDADQLLQEVVDLSKQSFNLYHAHIYLLNEAGDSLDLKSGAGEVGRRMVAAKHHIPLNSEKSLVARAARTQAGVVVNDVTIAPDFLPNPLLPDTRSEMAVPMQVAGKLIGVLDIQSETADHFTEVDVSVQTTLASQVAVALQNTRSFAQAQRQAESATALNLVTQKIQNTTSIEAALQITARELGHMLGMHQTLVELTPPLLTGEPTEAVNPA